MADLQMNLDILYQATELTGDPQYANAANAQADVTERTFIRDDGTTYHVVDLSPHTGEVLSRFTHQGEYPHRAAICQSEPMTRGRPWEA